MTNFDVWYKKNPTFRPDPNLTKETLMKTHVFLKVTEAEDMEDLYCKMQGEVWSPNGEARDFIRGKGLRHTSMSVGDVIITSDGTTFEVDDIGFREVK